MSQIAADPRQKDQLLGSDTISTERWVHLGSYLSLTAGFARLILSTVHEGTHPQVSVRKHWPSVMNAVFSRYSHCLDCLDTGIGLGRAVVGV